MSSSHIVRGRDGRIYFHRFTLNQRLQHIVLIFSFTLLVLTGIPLRYPDSRISEFIINVMGGYVVRSMLHRIGAVILIALSVYHLLYTLFSQRGRAEIRAMLPKWKDFTDLFHTLKYFFGLAVSGPRFERYNYIEKFEYFAVSWGTVVMVITGFMLWFAGSTMRWLPLWAVDVARVVHSWEAMLAFLTILIWHMYHAHLRPGTFPMGRSWLTGNMSEEEMRHHHPLEYERLLAESHKPFDPYEAGGGHR